MKFYALLILTSFSNIKLISSSCVSLYGSCNEDCDCCGFDSDPAVQCELRHPNLGRRCYISGNIGRKCNSHYECKSQNCRNGYCAPFNRPHIPTPKCPLTFSDIIPLDGLHPEFPDECADECSVLEKTGDFSNAVDGDLATAYINDRAINSGLLLYPEQNAPLRHLKLCSASDCPECDPKCYKLEGYCSEDDTYNLIKEEDFTFSTREECITFDLPDRRLNSHYKLTFPCQVETEPTCPEVNDCECDNGLTPFIPRPVAQGKCDGKTPTMPEKKLEFISATKLGDYTEIVYRIQNPGGGRDPVAFKHAIIQWDNSCCFDCYGSYLDVNGDKVLQQPPSFQIPAPDGFDEPCKEQCKSIEELDTLLLKEDDPELCMQGLKLRNPQVIGSQTYFFTVKVAGDVTMIEKTYGIVSVSGGRRGRSGTNLISYDKIMSPVCSCEENTTNGSECITYPMQIGEVSLIGNCNQLADS